jgi:hypothetical protein
MTYTINRANLTEAHIVLPASGAWTLDARLSDDPGIVRGAPFVLTQDGVSLFTGTCEFAGSFSAGRWRFTGGPTGCSILQGPMPSLYLLNQTLSGVASWVASQAGMTANFTGTDAALANVVMSPRVSYGEFLRYLFGNTFLITPASVLQVGPLVPNTNTGDFELQDFNNTTRKIQLAVNNTFLIQPGDVWTATNPVTDAQTFSIVSTVYEITAEHTRAVCEVI